MTLSFLKNLLSFSIITFLLLFKSSESFSHPHMFIDTSTQLIIEQGRVRSVKAVWKFEKMSSQSIIYTFDENKDSHLSPKEEGVLKSTVINNLKKHDFFTKFFINRKEVSMPKEVRHSVRIEKEILFIDFIFPFDIEISDKEKIVAVTIYDSTLFTAFSGDKDGAEVVGEPEIKVKKEVNASEFGDVELEYIYIINPSGKEEQQISSELVESAGKPEAKKNRGFAKDLFLKIGQTQFFLRKKIEYFSSKLKGDKEIETYFILIAIAFAFGAIHSLGPGHSKSLVVSYIFSSNNNRIKAVIVGAAGAFFHGLGAIVLTYLFQYLLSGDANNINRVGLNLYTLSYSLIIVIGLSLLLFKLLKLRDRDKKDMGLSFWPTCLVLGLTPCPATMLTMLFFISLNLVHFGVLMAFAITLGMSITVGIIGLLAVIFKDRVRFYAGGNSFILQKVDLFFDFGGPVAMIIFAALMLQTGYGNFI